MNYEVILNEVENQLKSDISTLKEWNNNYFHIQKERYLSDLKYFSSLSNIKSVLEIGAAPFHLSLCLKKAGYNLQILDISPERFDWFIKKNELDIDQLDIELDDISKYKNSFDLIIFTEVFEHLRINPIQSLKKIQSLLKPSGLLYLTTPNFYRHSNILTFIKGKGIVNAYYQFEKLEKLGHMGHVREYTKNEMRLFLENTGFEIIDFKYKNSKKHSPISKQGLITSIFNKTKSHMMFLAKKVKRN